MSDNIFIGESALPQSLRVTGWMSRSGCYIVSQSEHHNVSPGVTKSSTAGNKRAVLKVGSHAIIIFCGSTSG